MWACMLFKHKSLTFTVVSGVDVNLSDLHYNSCCIKLNGFEDCTFIRWAAIDQQLDAG